MFEYDFSDALKLKIIKIAKKDPKRAQIIKKKADEIKRSEDIIIFIDELHTLIGAGGAEGAIDASNILKPALSRGEIQCIGATTLDEFRKHIEKDAALERRFQTIMVEPPTVDETIEILKGLRDKYEAHHRVKFTDAAIEAAAKLSDRYITGRYLPDKAIDLIDEAGARARLSIMTAPPDVKHIEDKMETVKKEKEQSVKGQDFEKAAKFRDEERKLKDELAGIKKERENIQEIEGKQALFIVNLEPRKMAGQVSEGMLFAIGQANEIPVLVIPEKPVPDGSLAH
jgi:ATP-dependent Clp protease ATP-binding subunit ClpC